jgi:hypothetical protein
LSRRTGLPLNLAVVPFIGIELAMGFRPVSIERTLRVLADSLRRAAATESDACLWGMRHQ